MKKQQGVWKSHTGSWPSPAHCTQVEMGVDWQGGFGSRTFLTGVCLLAQNWSGPRSGQHKTLLGGRPKGPIPPEGKQPHCPHHHFPGCVAGLRPQFKCIGLIGLATCGGYTMCSYSGRAVWLLPWPGSRSWPHDAGSTILGYRRRGSLPVHCESPGVQGECLCV